VSPHSTIPEPFWLRPTFVGAVVIVLTLMKLWVAAGSNLTFDEGYYTVWSERLATGYLDHPPAVAAMIAAGRALLGDNELGVRLVALLMGLLLLALLYRTALCLADRAVAALAVLWYAAAPATGLNFISTPDMPSGLFWMAAVWAVAEFVRSRQPMWWLLAGLFTGLGLWSKYTVAFLPPGLLLFVLVGAERRQWLKLWQVWAAPIVALVVFSPVILWNAERGWSSFIFQGRRTTVGATDGNMLANLGDFVGGQAGFMLPILFVFALIGLVLVLRRPLVADRTRLLLPALSGLPALAYFIVHTAHARVEANWMIPLWPSLTLLAAWAVLRLWGGRLLGAAVLLQTGLGVALILFVYAQTLFQLWPLSPNIDRTLEAQGWRTLAGRLQALAERQGARWIATETNYGLTGELASYFLFARAAEPVRQADEWVRWENLPPLPAATLDAPALFVRYGPLDAGPPTNLFRNVRPLTTLERETSGGKPIESLAVFLVSDPLPGPRAELLGQH
jgi:4-amino-4-deoxy-L-arabinose transferase-like glycosyltransferase